MSYPMPSEYFTSCDVHYQMLSFLSYIIILTWLIYLYVFVHYTFLNYAEYTFINLFE